MSLQLFGTGALLLLLQTLLHYLLYRDRGSGYSDTPMADFLHVLAGCLLLLAGILALFAGQFTRKVNWSASIIDSFMDSLFNHATDGMLILDPEGKVLKVNHAFEVMFGYREEELIGQSLPTIPAELVDESVSLLRLVKEGGRVSGYETIRRTKQGTDIHVSIALSPILHGSGAITGFLAIIRNITERKQTDELLRKTEKLSVIGQLAAGVAHEIRNPLTTLRGFVQLQRQRQLDRPEYLDLMLAELDRINLIVSEFLVFSKPHHVHFRYTDLSQTINDVLQLVKEELERKRLSILRELEPGLPKIKCEEVQLKQLFYNILKNAMEASPPDSEIRITAKRSGDNFVLISIIDQGVGIAEEDLPRIGEPFYTTKEERLGLGIIVSQYIVSCHQGDMKIRSAPDQGTTVDIMLPVHF